MKKFLLCCVGTMLLAFGATSALAAEANSVAQAQPATSDKAKASGNPVEQLTGKIWLESSDEIKKALLFGVDCAVSIEHAVAAKYREAEKALSKRDKKAGSTSTLSPFEMDWAKAFTNVPRGEIVSAVDAWYAANPDQVQRPVFEVLWYEIIQPKTKK